MLNGRRWLRKLKLAWRLWIGSCQSGVLRVRLEGAAVSPNAGRCQMGAPPAAPTTKISSKRTFVGGAGGPAVLAQIKRLSLRGFVRLGCLLCPIISAPHTSSYMGNPPTVGTKTAPSSTARARNSAASDEYQNDLLEGFPASPFLLAIHS